MSYCVNCGVKLDPSLKRCPLCNTPVVNPNDLAAIQQPVPPFPHEKGQVEGRPPQRPGYPFIYFPDSCRRCMRPFKPPVFRESLWSLYVIGACVVVWVLAVPAVIYTRMPLYGSILCDGLAIALYEFMISLNTPQQEWFFRLALPITALCTVAALIFTFLMRKVSSAFLMTGLYFFVEAALICASIELLIERYLALPFRLTWSAVVLSISAVIVIALVTILSRARLRNAVRRRLHF